MGGGGGGRRWWGEGGEVAWGGGVLVSRAYSKTCNRPAQGTLPPAPPHDHQFAFSLRGPRCPAFQGLVASSVRGIFFLSKAQQ